MEVSCDPIPKKRKFVIHGLENRIPYADIDFTLTADPLQDRAAAAVVVIQTMTDPKITMIYTYKNC